MAGKIFQVSEVNLYIKNLFREDYLLNHLQVEGEVSNAKLHSSGHIYFTIKDEAAAIDCVLFANYASGLEILPSNGKKIIVTGGIGLYEKTGRYQIYVRDVKEAGQGDLFQKLEELKKKLSAEGIFQKEKREIPELPEQIGIVTSATGAAIQDILQIAGRRNKGVQLILYPSLVQGERAAANIAAGIEYFNRQKKPVDVLIVGRGGGSIEDLWPFNEEAVVRAVYHSKIPVISAVGHETDVTLVDLVSDLRAPTPSAAAELAIPELRDQMQVIRESFSRLNREFCIYLERYRNETERMRLRLMPFHPSRKLEDIRFHILEREKELNREYWHYLKRVRWRIELLEKQLLAVHPKAKLENGYAYLTNESGMALSGIDAIQIGDTVIAHLKDGKLKLEVEEKESACEEEK